jgi:hypothetical protein
MARFPIETLYERKYSDWLWSLSNGYRVSLLQGERTIHFTAGRADHTLYCRESGPYTPFPISSVCGAFLASHIRHRNLVLGNRGSDDSSKKIVCLTAWYSKLISKLMVLAKFGTSGEEGRIYIRETSYLVSLARKLAVLGK